MTTPHLPSNLRYEAAIRITRCLQKGLLHQRAYQTFEPFPVNHFMSCEDNPRKIRCVLQCSDSSDSEVERMAHTELTQTGESPPLVGPSHASNNRFGQKHLHQEYHRNLSTNPGKEHPAVGKQCSMNLLVNNRTSTSL